MRSQQVPSIVASLLLLAVAPAWSQSIQTDGNIETDAQLVSKVATGTAPLAVSSTTMVPSLNADLLDGVHKEYFAYYDAEYLPLFAQVQALSLQVNAAPAQVPQTGQATCYEAAGGVTTCGTGIGLAQDGDLQLGVNWPNPRFTKNGDGTVTDNLTGLIWLENADCAAATMDWAAALAFTNTLFDGSATHNDGDCGLSDSSAVGAWRLPNLRELQSLVHYGVSFPAVPNTAGTGQCTEGDPFSFISLLDEGYWSSTTFTKFTENAWSVYMPLGNVYLSIKANLNYVWPVRGGQ